jgi:NADPH:quinone reductase-like Zn-dependent oxidoreductase
LIGASSQARRHGISVITGPGAYQSEHLEQVVDLAEQGGFRATIDRTFAFEEIRAAHSFVDTGRKRGSVVVTVSAEHK